MTKLSFVKGIEYLNAYYVNFKFDINDKLAQQIWYQALSDIDDKSFEIIVADYCKNNIYAPQSPTHLLEWFGKIKYRVIDNLLAQIKSIESKFIYEIDRYTVKTDYTRAIKECTDPLIIELLTLIKDEKISITKEFIHNYLTNVRKDYLSITLKLQLKNNEILKIGENK